MSAMVAGSAYAGDSILTCKLQKTTYPKREAVATVNLSKSDADELLDDGVLSDGGVDMGPYNYAFSVGGGQTKTGYDFYIQFTEGNMTQDEVGELSCAYDSKIGSEVFCKEPITGSGIRKPLQFSCQITK